MKEQMAIKENIEVAKLETAKEIRSEIAPLRESIADVDTKAAQALDETKMLHQRMVTAEQGQIREFDRVGRLESEVQELKKQLQSLKLNAGGDPGYKRLAFLGLPKVSYETRIAGMRGFMATHFKDVHIEACSVIFSGKRGEHREATNVGYVQFASSDVRDHVLKIIEDKKHGCKIDGKQVDIKRSRTRNAGDRNRALQDAADKLKKITGDVAIQWKSGQRGVTVRGEYAYTQPDGTSLGEFAGDYAHLEL